MGFIVLYGNLIHIYFIMSEWVLEGTVSLITNMSASGYLLKFKLGFELIFYLSLCFDVY